MTKTGAGDAENLVGGSGESIVEARDVHVNEEVIWKARAEDAEEELEVLMAKVSELESALGKANETISEVERRGEIDRELTAAKAVDLETARLLTEAVIAEMDQPDVVIAVRELCDRKPFLFGRVRHGASGGVSMSPASEQQDVQGLGAMAQSARSSGNRGELLRYLRARRVI
jgi:hypothetical protein